MTAFDAGDWLKNRKLRKDFELDGHPTATFTLERVSDVVRDGAKFTAKAEGVLRVARQGGRARARRPGYARR